LETGPLVTEIIAFGSSVRERRPKQMSTNARLLTHTDTHEEGPNSPPG